MDLITATTILILLTSIFLFARKINLQKKSLVIKQNEIEKLKLELSEVQLSFNKLANRSHTEELLSRLVTQSPNAIMLMDKDGYIEWINDGFTRMYEFSFEEFTNKLGKNYKQTSFSPNVQSRLDYITGTKNPFRYEALNITKTGRSLWTQTALMPILDDNGNVTHMATIDTDIHTRVLKSEKVIEEMDELNQRIDHLEQQFGFLETEFANLFDSISEFYNSIESTDQILSFIKAISDKTKILGFNASIEASRAGENGRGFRIITNEIVGISEETIKNIMQINKIIDSIKSRQDVMLKRKVESETRINEYHQVFGILKHELRDIENAILEFKSLA